MKKRVLPVVIALFCLASAAKAQEPHRFIIAIHTIENARLSNGRLIILPPGTILKFVSVGESSTVNGALGSIGVTANIEDFRWVHSANEDRAEQIYFDELQAVEKGLAEAKEEQAERMANARQQQQSSAEADDIDYRLQQLQDQQSVMQFQQRIQQENQQMQQFMNGGN